MHVVKTQRFRVGANWMEEQEMEQIQFRERYGDVDGLCYEHRPPARPSLTALCWWNVWSESLSKSKMAMRKLKEQDYGATCFDNIFLFKLCTYIKFLTEHRTMGRRGKGHLLEACNQCVLSLMRMDWNRGWSSGALRFLRWYELPLHQGKFIRAMTERVDCWPQAHPVTPQKLSHILYRV